MSGSPKSSYSADEVKAEVRQTIQQLNEMTRSEASFDEFCEAVLSKVVKLTGAHGALLWQTNGNAQPVLTHKAAGRETEGITPNTEQHANLVLDVITKEQPVRLASESLEPTETTTSDDRNYLMLFTPVYNREKKCCGSIELLQRSEISPTAQDGYLKFLTQIAQLFPRWHEQQDLAKLSKSATNWNQKIEFVTEVHKTIDAKETAFAIANEARRILKSDRVSVGHWNGSRCKIVAISSQDRFDNRANVVRLLGNVATASVSADSQFWITGDTEGLAPEVAKRINEYLDESHCRTLAVIPLVKRPEDTPDLEMNKRRWEKPKKLGCLIIEYFDADVPQQQISDDCELVIKQSQLAMDNSRRHSEILFLPLWQRLGWIHQFMFRDHYAKTMTALSALGLLMLAMFLIPAELRMKASGVLRPTNRVNVFAQTDGIVRNILVDDGQKVAKGELLMEIENIELDLQITSAESELQTLKTKMDNIRLQLTNVDLKPEDSVAIAGEERALKDRQASLMRDLEILAVKKKAQRIVSPISGTVITWDAKRRLKDLPVSMNSPVLAVADEEGDWQIELRIPEMKLGYVQEALLASGDEPIEIDYIVGTDANSRLKGKLVRIHAQADVSEGGTKEFRAIADADDLREHIANPQTGAGVTAKIRCGKRKLGFVWFYQVYDFFRTKVFF